MQRDTRALPSKRSPRAVARAHRSWWRALLADERGAATTETVIMIPMYAIVWGCIVYVTNHFQSTIEMRARMRRDTWAYAYTACQDEPSTRTTFELSRGLVPDASGSSGDPEGSAEGGGGVIGIVGAVDTILSYIPGLNFQTLVGSRNDGRTPRPAVLGGGELRLSSDLTVLCNERPQSTLSFIVDAVRSAFGF